VGCHARLSAHCLQPNLLDAKLLQWLLQWLLQLRRTASSPTALSTSMHRGEQRG
jgi:hypothetical protein